MPKYDSLLFEGDFAVGSTQYSDHYPGHEWQNHIVIPLAPSQNKSMSIKVIVDTAAKWCIIHPEIAQEWEKYFFYTYDLEQPLNIRGMKFEKGKIAHANVVLNASNGKDLVIEAKFFIPILSPDQIWSFPNFIGLDGMLNCIRFAVDPSENAISFGKS